MFKIVQISEPYKVIPKEFQNFEILLKCDYSESHSKSHFLYLTDEVKEQIFTHISWKKTTSNNIVEQGGILLGNTYYDEEKCITFGIVEKAISGKSAIGSPGYLEMNHQTWKEMIDEVDLLLNDNKNLNLQIIGWYHTHPNSLGVFMSGTDRNTQKNMFGNIWQFAIVLNPHRQIWRVFYGSNSEECKGAFFNSKPLK